MTNQKEFIPARLTEAREEKGMSKVELARRIGISRVSLTRLEGGISRPNPEIIAKIASVLNENISFFFTERDRNYQFASPVSFRRWSTKEATARMVSKMKMLKANDSLRFVYDYIKPQVMKIPTNLVGDNPLELDEYDVESVALNVRSAWGIDNRPIRNLTTLVENNGVVCFEITLPGWIDGVSYWVAFSDANDLRPVMVLNSGANYFRNRFDVAHELGHLVLHHALSVDEMEKNNDVVEKQAHRFASAFLMPAETFSESVYYATVSFLPALKDKWGVSMAAIIRRMSDLKIITERQYTNMNIELSRKGWRKVEPGDRRIPREQPYFMNQASNYLVDNGLCSLSAFQECLGFSNEALTEYFSNKELFLDNPDNGKKIIEFIPV